MKLLFLRRLYDAIAYYDDANEAVVRYIIPLELSEEIRGFGVLHTQAVARLIQRQQHQNLLDTIAVTEPGLLRITWMLCRAEILSISDAFSVNVQTIIQLFALMLLPFGTIGLGFLLKPSDLSPAVLLLSPIIVWFATVYALVTLYLFDVVVVALLALTLVADERLTPLGAVAMHASLFVALSLFVTLFHAVGWRQTEPTLMVPATVAGLVMLTLVCEVVVRGGWHWLARSDVFHPDDMRSITAPVRRK